MALGKTPRNTRESVGVWILEKAWALWESLSPPELAMERWPPNGHLQGGWPVYQQNKRSMQAPAMRIGKNYGNKGSDSGALHH